VTEEADNGGFLSHSTGLSLDNLPEQMRTNNVSIRHSIGAQQGKILK